ncbi:hypothetical protein PEPMIC_00040 [Parvimonas micra ATCC 33270]|uniref:Uncharacterized protein n=1 Tax=Parvimonas micra ATCC 33270 TaxID=411465 RepID=A8SI86_9FIRM|nr:hypothetical protein PEPMIC_00040 [Parvimonas micra ATCC 33270]
MTCILDEDEKGSGISGHPWRLALDEGGTHCGHPWRRTQVGLIHIKLHKRTMR